MQRPFEQGTGSATTPSAQAGGGAATPETPRLKGSAADWFHRVAFAAAEKTGSPWSFMAALSIIAGWAATGPFFHFGDTWQLVINTGTTIITFLMVFLIQASQNRDSRAIHLKLDELIRTSRARNAFADLENATDRELDTFAAEFKALREAGVDVTAAAERARSQTHRKHRS